MENRQRFESIGGSSQLHSLPSRHLVHQPITPEVRPQLHLNILIPDLALDGPQRMVHEIIAGLEATVRTGTLFLLEDVAPSYSIQDTDRFRVITLAEIDETLAFKAVALEVLASPVPVLYTFLIPPSQLKQLWDFGVVTVPVVDKPKRFWHSPVTDFNHPNVPFIVAVSEDIARQVRESGWEKQVVTMRHAYHHKCTADELRAQRSALRAKHGISDDTLLIGMVGHFKTHKAYTRAIEVLHYVQQFCRARLMILGEWRDEDGTGTVTYNATCRRALDLGVMQDLTMPGAVNPVDSYYAAFDVLLDTSLYKGANVSIFEARQSGCPVVSADLGEGGQVLSDGAIFIEDLCDSRAFAEAVLTITNSGARQMPSGITDPDLVPRLWRLMAKYAVPSVTDQTSTRVGTLFVSDSLHPDGPLRSLTGLICQLSLRHRVHLCILDTVKAEEYSSAIEAPGCLYFSLHTASSMIERIERLLFMIDSLGVRNVCFWHVAADFKLLLAKILVARSIHLIDVGPIGVMLRELEEAKVFQIRIGTSTDSYIARLNHIVAADVDDELPLAASVVEKTVIISDGALRQSESLDDVPDDDGQAHAARDVSNDMDHMLNAYLGLLEPQ